MSSRSFFESFKAIFLIEENGIQFNCPSIIVISNPNGFGKASKSHKIAYQFKIRIPEMRIVENGSVVRIIQKWILKPEIKHAIENPNQINVRRPSKRMSAIFGKSISMHRFKARSVAIREPQYQPTKKYMLKNNREAFGLAN